ncbi:hypothetical protein [Breznakiella homolactica]|uniref:hypothetical protein n=1 Tax=Breznakiella homolactica TaxID=2798577 RepID=UPI0032DF5F28
MVESMGAAEGYAAFAQGAAGISSVILAIPAGYFAHRLGRKNYIRLCLICITIILLLIPASGYLASKLALSPGSSLVIFLILMFIYGAFWIGIVVNSFPMLWQMASFGTMGYIPDCIIPSARPRPFWLLR